MKNIRVKILTIILFIVANISFTNLFAQTDTLKQTDSINIQLLKAYNLKIKEIRQQHIADSFKRAELEQRLKSLKTTDNLKKEVLLKQLKELSNKEAQRLAIKKAKIDSLRINARAFPVTGFKYFKTARIGV